METTTEQVLLILFVLSIGGNIFQWFVATLPVKQKHKPPTNRQKPRFRCAINGEVLVRRLDPSWDFNVRRLYVAFLAADMTYKYRENEKWIK